MKQAGWLTDDQGNPSLTRVLSMGGFVVSAALSGLQAIGAAEGVESLVMSFLTASTAGKIGQKFAEKPKS